MACLRPNARQVLRTTRWVLALLVVCGSGALLRADERESGKIRLARESLQPALPGQPYSGIIEFTSPQDGLLLDVELGGPGWVDAIAELAVPVTVKRGEIVRFPFQAQLKDDAGKLEIRVTVNTTVVEKKFDLSPERIAAIGKDRPSVRVAEVATDPQSAGNGEPGPRGCDDYLLRVRGRIEYFRAGVDTGPPDGDFNDPFDVCFDNSVPPDGDCADPGDVAVDCGPPDGDFDDPLDIPPAIIGADGIRFQIMDEDAIDSEVIYDGHTNEQGYFDITTCWDDCDITGCDDPDVYLRYECNTGICFVRSDDAGEDIYAFSSIDTLIFENATSGEINFGVQRPTNTNLHAALHIHNSITRAHRYVLEETAGFASAHVAVVWQDTNGARYTDSDDTIYIGPDEQWNEGTHIHEWGHHLLHEWADPVPPSYCNGFCDDNANRNCGMEPCVDNFGIGGHCIWCNETETIAWNEGFPNWLASDLLRIWQDRYGGPPPTAINDNRYTIEFVQACCDGTIHNALTTENFVAALLRDMEDPPRDPGQTACPQDSLWLGADEILAVVREYQPNRVTEFINGFRTAYPHLAHDFRSTAQAVAAVYVAGLPPLPPLQVLATNGCGTYRTGETIRVSADVNASHFSTCMRWLRNGSNVVDGARVSGATTNVLTITNAVAGDAGLYTLRITSCDGAPPNQCAGTQTTTSPPISVRIIDANRPGHRVTGWGRNFSGSLGRGSYEPPTDSNPADVVSLDNVVDVSAGYWTAFALRTDGTVWGWGRRYLGNGSADSSHTPVQVSNLSDIVAVSAGGNETCMALDSDGSVWTWGANWYGMIGDGTGEWRLTPVRLPGLTCVVAISMGASSAAAVTADGQLWTWGNNGYGELGLGVYGGWYTTPQPVPGLTDVVEVECGWSHLIARKSDGTVWCSGSNIQGQLGDGTFNSRNTFGQVLGLSGVVSVKAGASHSLAVKADQTPWSWGSDEGSRAVSGNSAVPTRCVNPQTVRSLDAGHQNSLFVDTEGAIWTCGYPGYGALGRPGSDPMPAPVDLRVGAAVKVSAGIDFMQVISPGARITAPLAHQSVAGCGTARLRVTAVGEPPLAYRWERSTSGGAFDVIVNGGRFSGATGPVLTILPTDSSDSGLYRVVVSNATHTVSSATSVFQSPPFFERFDSGNAPRWGNERGAWTTAGGGYSAGTPSLIPATYSSFILPQTDFSIELDVVRASLANFTANSGIWLRSTLVGQQPSGVLLSLGDVAPGGTGDVFWTRWNGSTWQSPEGIAEGVFTEEQTVHVRIDVRGDTYAAYINDSPTPTTQLVSPDFPAGRIALFDNAAADTRFDNVFIQTLPSCNVPGVTPPSVVLRPQSQTVSAGDPVTLDIVAQGTGPLQYQWVRNGVCIHGATLPSYTFTASLMTVGRYECTVSNECGSVGSFPAIVTIADLPGIVDGDANESGDGPIEFPHP